MLDASLIATLDFGDGHACTPEEYLFLGALVRLTAPRTIVEIGTSTGIGTLVMAAALLEAGPAAGRAAGSFSVAGASEAPRLTTIDLPLGRSTFGDGLARNRAAVERVLPAVAGVIDWRLGESHAVLESLVAEGRQADLVFIDGGHSEAIVRGDWARALALRPRVIVLHDTVHLADVVRVVEELSAQYPGVTISYPRRALPGAGAAAAPDPPTAPGTATALDRATPPAGHGPGFTIFSNLDAVRDARAASAGPVRPAAHEVASALLHDRIITPAQARRIAPQAATDPPRLRELEIVLSGRNDDYGGEDFHERMLAVASFNHARLTEAGVPHRFTLVEWNPPEGKVPLIDRLRARLPWWHRSWVVSRAWHAWYQENPRLQFMEFFAKNAGIRRATGDWILTTNSDVFLGREIVARLAEGGLVPGTLYRASRLDLDRGMPRDEVSWERLEDPRHLLRRFDPEPPFFNEAAGDFLLLDRESYHRVGGFNERIRFSKIHKDGQFCVQAHHHGLAIESLGPAYHIDHDGSFINTKHTYQPGYADAPFGPEWPCWQPHWNREDWGIRNAIEDPQGGTTWLRTPEERGPALSLVLHGAGDATAHATAIDAVLATPGSFEVLVLDPEPALAQAISARQSDPRLRVIAAPDLAEPDIAARTPLGAALRRAAACAHGRHFAYLPGPVELDGLDRLLVRLDALGPDVAGPVVHAIDAAGGAPGARSLTVVSRRALDRLDGVDALAADVVGEFADRARRTFGATVVDGVAIRAVTSLDAAPLDTAIDRAWSALGDGGVVPAAIAADLTRRGERLTAHLRARLARELPDDARDVAVFGISAITPFAMAALRALGRRVVGVFAPDGDGSLEIAGMPVRPPSELDDHGAVWVVAACASPADVAALYGQVPMARTLHVVEPASLRPASPPFASGPSFEGLAYARGRREAGALREAEAAYRALLRDPGCRDAVRARYELALVQEQLGDVRAAEAGLRWALRHWPDQRGTMAYNLGSLYERQGRWGHAAGAFTRALRLARPDDAARVGGCHFHLGEIALAQGDDAAAREHFTRALEALPVHGKAQSRLAALVMAYRAPK